MKIISRTRKISVSGVILISQNIPPWPPDVLMATDGSPGDRRVDQARGADMDRRVDPLDLLRKVVVENHRDNRDDQAQRRRNQRFGNARRDDREAASAHHRHRLERHENSHDRAEQPDERCRCTRRREHPDRSAQPQHLGEPTFLIDLAEPGAIGRLRLADNLVENALAGVVAAVHLRQRVIEFALLERRDRAFRDLGRARGDAPERPYPLEDYRHADHRDDQQRIRRVPALLNHRKNAELILHLQTVLPKRITPEPAFSAKPSGQIKMAPLSSGKRGGGETEPALTLTTAGVYPKPRLTTSRRNHAATKRKTLDGITRR